MQDILDKYGLSDQDGGAARLRIASDDYVLKLMEGCVVATLHIGRWGGKAKLRPEDLGIKLSDDPEVAATQRDLLSLGTKLLMPAGTLKRLESIDSMARRNLKDNSYQTIFGCVVTPASWRRFMARHEQLKAEYLAIRDTIVDGYDELVADMRRAYEPLAHVAWRRENRVSDREQRAPEEFVSGYLDRIMARVPTRDYVQASFSFEVTATFIPLPSMIAEDVAAANRRRAEIDEAAVLRSAVAAQWLDRKREVIDSFVSDLVVQLRTQVYDSLTSAREAAERNGGKLPSKTLTGLRGLLETVRALDPYGDEELEVALTSIRSNLFGDEDGIDHARIVRQITDLGTIIRTSLILAGAAPRDGSRPADWSTPSTPLELRRARAQVDLENVAVPPAVLKAMGGSDAPTATRSTRDTINAPATPPATPNARGTRGPRKL